MYYFIPVVDNSLCKEAPSCTFPAVFFVYFIIYSLIKIENRLLNKEIRTNKETYLYNLKTKQNANKKNKKRYIHHHMV